MNIQLKAKRQDGFTIIELVVVILLLGILAATALPRFLDVTDEAHDAVVDGVVGSLNTGSALFRATWVATGQSTTAAVDYGDVAAQQNFANSSGYPIGLDATIDASTCSEVFVGIQQSGGLPSVAPATAGWDSDAADDSALETLIEAQSADFVAVSVYDATDDVNGDSTNDVADTTECRFYYTGQFAEGTATANQTIPVIILNLLTGTATEDTYTLDEA